MSVQKIERAVLADLETLTVPCLFLFIWDTFPHAKGKCWESVGLLTGRVASADAREFFRFIRIKPTRLLVFRGYAKFLAKHTHQAFSLIVGVGV